MNEISQGMPAQPDGLGRSRFVASPRYLAQRKVRARVIRLVLFLASMLSLLITSGIVLILVSESLTFFKGVSLVDFLTDTQWTPAFADNARFGILPLFSGTLMSSAIALSVAVPLGLMLSFYLSEFASSRVREVVKPVMELLSGVPTVAFGYFALLTVTPFLKATILPGLDTYNLLAPGLVMGIMILPYIVTLSEDAMRAVPSGLREGAYGLGFSRTQTCVRVIFPAAFSGITAAIILGMSRAVGETMVVAIAAGQNAVMAFNPLEGAATITTFIVQISQGDLPHGTIAYQSIFAAGLVLFVTTLVFNVVAFHLRRKYRETY